MDLFTWGSVVSHTDPLIIIKFLKDGSEYYYKVEKLLEGHNHVGIYTSISSAQRQDISAQRQENKKALLNFDDYSLKSSLINFSRKVKDIEYIFKDSQIPIKLESKNVDYIKPLKEAKYKFDHFICLDIETRTVDNSMLPYCICLYDGENKYSFYLSDYAAPAGRDADHMIVEAIKVLFTKLDNGQFKYNDYIVYAHNFSKFDGVFILRNLIKYVQALDLSIFDSTITAEEKAKAKKNNTEVDEGKLKFKIIKRDNDFINIGVNVTNREFNINFRDSLLLLPSALKNWLNVLV